MDDITRATQTAASAGSDGGWLRRNATVLAAIKDLVTILLALVAIGSLILAANQLRTTSNSIKSNTFYQLSREGREIGRTIDPESINDPKVIGYIFNYFHSAWQQHRLETLDDEIWNPITVEICYFLKAAHTEKYWNPDTKKMYSEGFVKFIDDWGRTCLSTIDRGKR